MVGGDTEAVLADEDGDNYVKIRRHHDEEEGKAEGEEGEKKE